MTNNHLTEETLQAFLLKETQEDSISMHLSACTNCREKLEEYQYLIDDVKKVKAETFSFDVASLVMEKIIAVETQKEKNTSTVLYLSMFIVSVVTLFLVYPFLKPILIQFKSFSVMTIIFILVSTVGIAIFLLNDLFRQYKQKEILLSR